MRRTLLRREEPLSRRLVTFRWIAASRSFFEACQQNALARVSHLLAIPKLATRKQPATGAVCVQGCSPLRGVTQQHPLKRFSHLLSTPTHETMSKINDAGTQLSTFRIVRLFWWATEAKIATQHGRGLRSRVQPAGPEPRVPPCAHHRCCISLVWLPVLTPGIQHLSQHEKHNTTQHAPIPYPAWRREIHCAQRKLFARRKHLTQHPWAQGTPD